MTVPSTASTDAWVLLSVIEGDSGSGASLEDIVSAGDAANCALFLFEELDGGLARLANAGLIVIRNKRVHATDEAIDLYRRAPVPYRSPIISIDNLAQGIAVLCESRSRLEASPEPHFIVEEFVEACEAYLAKAYGISR